VELSRNNFIITHHDITLQKRFSFVAETELRIGDIKAKS